jgi:DNA-binding CsgD family transcriptional regulator
LSGVPVSTTTGSAPRMSMAFMCTAAGAPGGAYASWITNVSGAISSGSMRVGVVATGGAAGGVSIRFVMPAIIRIAAGAAHPARPGSSRPARPGCRTSRGTGGGPPPSSVGRYATDHPDGWMPGAPQERGMVRAAAVRHDERMASPLTVERVRRDVEVVATAGLDLATFLSEVDVSIRRVLRPVATCVATVDPTTSLLTSTYKFGDLYGRDERDLEWGMIEYGGEETTSFLDIAATPSKALGMHIATGGDLERSLRLRECIRPYYGYGDELRVMACVDGRMWGALAFFRAADDDPFTDADVEFASTLSTVLANGFRSGLLTNATARLTGEPSSGPAVIIVDQHDQLSQVSLGAEERLRQVIVSEHSAGPLGTVAALVASARRYARGELPVVPRSRLRLADGRWVVLQASPMASRDGVTGDVVITIEDARPPEIVPLLVEAFGLTARERDVTQLVLQGAETKDIATALHLSAYTVQDHLKSIFAKADVRSRRELMSKVFFDQYQPRLGAEVAPSGWFATP